MYKVQNSFNAGELSPLLEGRSDLEFYFRGCSTLQNFLVLAQGGVERRPGSEYLGTASHPTDGSRATFVRLVPFEYSTTQAYILEFGDTYFRIFKNGVRVDNTSQSIEDITDATQVNIQITGHGYSTGDVIYIDGVGGLTPDLDGEYVITKVDANNFTLDGTTYSDYSGTWDSAGTATNPVEVTTVYSSTDLPNLRFTQSADTLYITAVDHSIRPYKVTRTSDTAWTITAITFTLGPFIERDVDGTTLTPSGTTGSITLTASAATFDSDMVGALFKLVQNITAYVKGTFTLPDQYSSAIDVTGSVRLITEGTWDGVVQLQRYNEDTAAWEDHGPALRNSGGSTNYDETFDQEDEFKYREHRLYCKERTSGTVAYTLTSTEKNRKGIVRIDSFTSSTVVGGTVLQELGSTNATKEWYEGCWSDYRGWPGVMTFFQQRTMWGGTSYQPQTIWGSRVSDFESMQSGANDNDAVQYTIDSDQVNTIKWLIAHNVLLIGTSGGEWKLFGGSAGEPVTPSNVQVLPQSDRGSSDVQGVLLNAAVLFVRRGGKDVRELAYSFDQDVYISPNRSIRAEHILSDVVNEMTKQKDPQTILWCVLNDGNIVTFSYEREEEVIAWAKQTTSGDFESIARIPGSDGDEIYVSVLRTIDGTDYRYIERFKPRTFSSLTNAFFVDSGKTVTGSGMATLSGLSHLEGEKVAVLGDGEVLYDGSEGASIVSGGVCTLPTGSSVDTAQVGLPFTSTVETMPLAVPGAVMQGKQKRVSQVTGKFIKTANGEVSGNNGNQDLGLSYSSTVTTKKLPVLNRHDRDAQVSVIQSDPLPMTIIMLGIEFEAY